MPQVEQAPLRDPDDQEAREVIEGGNEWPEAQEDPLVVPPPVRLVPEGAVRGVRKTLGVSFKLLAGGTLSTFR